MAEESEMSGTSIGGKRLTWRELAEWQQEKIAHLSKFQSIVFDLDRNESGRHEGDVDSYDPTGTSQGNPFISTGSTFGYTFSRIPIVMPPRERRHDPDAWLQRKSADAKGA